VFKEKSLNHAQFQVHQASTQIWHTFDIDTLSTNDEFIDVTLDVSSALQTPEDLARVEVRFLVSRNEGGEKAEIDCANLQVGGTAHPPAAGWEVKPAGFDLHKVTASDGDKDKLDEIPVNEVNPHIYQGYTFAPSVDPSNLPGVADLRFIFKEKSLNQALLQVYQASTRTWHSFELDTLSTDDAYIDTILDLTDVLETAEDYVEIEVRFLASRNDGGEKAEVDLVSLYLADLVGDTTADVASAFEAINAASVWGAGNTGGGIGVAVLDSGVKKYQELEKDTRDNKTGLEKGWNALKHKEDGRKDKYGHGTLVASVVSNQRRNAQGKFHGVAPDSTIIPVQVLDEEGKGTYSQVIAGIQWVVEHKDEYNIRVMNLSLSAPVRSHYWDDPLNQAVMRAWGAGIVVVVAAGNSGPDPMSIGVPGNVPYAITVGALTDAYTPGDWSDDYIPPFSAAGPTFEGFVKPDLVAPGGHVVGLMSDKCKLAKDHPDYKIDKDYYKLSDTSMSAAQVSGVVALLLARSPGLTPDQVKYRLLASAVPVLHPDGTLTPSIWQQGAGRADAYAAVYGDYTGVANQGLDVGADLAGTRHFGGYARWDPETNQYYLVDQDGHAWRYGQAWSDSIAWSEDGSRLLAKTDSGNQWITANPGFVEIDDAAAQKLPVIEAPSLPYNASNAQVNDVMDKIPLVVYHADHFTCASHAGLNNLMPSVADGNVIGPHAGDFAFVGEGGNVLFEYSQGSLRLIRDNPIARFGGDQKSLPLDVALKMFETGEIDWTGNFGDWPARGVPGCDESSQPE
jgi:subtilisin family serine protease